MRSVLPASLVVTALLAAGFGSPVSRAVVRPPLPRLVVVLNPGHNGGDGAHPRRLARQVPAGFGRYKDCETTGTATDAGYPEHVYTWDVARRVRTILRSHGIHVIMTRHDDHSFGPCVDRRAAIGNAADVAAVVSIHGDGAPSSGHGFFVNTAARRPHGASEHVMRQDTRLARVLRDALVRMSGLPTSNYLGTHGIVATTKFAALNLATRPAAFLEIGNMRNSGDAALQSSRSGRARIASAVAAGILAFVSRD